MTPRLQPRKPARRAAPPSGDAATRRALVRLLAVGVPRYEASGWFAEPARTVAEAWATCPRGDWLLLGACQVAVDRAALTLAACACASFARAESARNDGARNLLEAAEAWAAERTQAARRRLATAWREAQRPGVAQRDAVLGAAIYAAETVGLASAAPLAAWLSVVSVSTSTCVMPGAFDTARRLAHAACAELVRRHLPWAAIEAALAVPKGRKS
jgi:hypothetical protein